MSESLNTNSQELNTMASLHTVSVNFDYVSGQYIFVDTSNKNKEIRFSSLPISLDVRNGVRDTAYLLADQNGEPGKAYAPVTEGEARTVQYTMPFLVFPRGWFVDERSSVLNAKIETDDRELYANSYTILQGNTRYLALTQIIEENTYAYQVAKEAGEEALKVWEATHTRIAPFNFQILTVEQASSLKQVLWLQRSINDGVKPHELREVVTSIVNQYSNVKAAYPDLKYEQAVAMVAEQFNCSSSNITRHLQAFKNFDEQMWQYVTDGIINYDIAFQAYTRFNKTVSKDNACQVNGQPVTFPHFFEFLWAKAQETYTKRGSVESPKITKAIFDKAVKEYIELFGTVKGQEETEDLISETDSDNSGLEGEGSEEEEKTPKVNPYQDLTREELLQAYQNKLVEMQEQIFTLMSAELTDNSLLYVLPKVDQILSDLRVTDGENKTRLVTVEQEELIRKQKQLAEEAKAKQKEADKAAKLAEREEAKKQKEAAKTQAKLDQVADDYAEGKAAAEAAETTVENAVEATV